MDNDFRKSALAYHRSPRPGKLSVEATKRMANQRDLALAYSPGVAAPCEAIAADPAKVNADPEGEAWFFKMKLDDASSLQRLMTRDQYTEFLKGL